jgi:tetratricopeptide (TPR) repeat protein
MGGERSVMLHSKRWIGLVCLISFAVVGAGCAAAQTPLTEPKPADSLNQCENNPDVDIAILGCQAIIQDRSQSPQNRAAAYASMGFSSLDDQHYDQAAEYFNKALTFDPNSDDAYRGRSDVEFSIGQYDTAVADAKKTIRLNPNSHPDSYLLLGTLVDRNGNHDARIAYMTKAIEILPTYAEAYAGRGHGYMDEKKYDLALADFNKAISLKPSLGSVLRPNFVVIYIERASDFMTNGQYQAGIDDLTKVLQLDPNNARALGDLGDAYNVTKQYDKAVAITTRDITINPDYAFAHTNRGIAYLNTGKYALALADLNKAIQLGDGTYISYFIRGEIYQNESNNAAALSDYRKSLTLAPADAPRRDNIQKAIDGVQ